MQGVSVFIVVVVVVVVVVDDDGVVVVTMNIIKWMQKCDVSLKRISFAWNTDE